MKHTVGILALQGAVAEHESMLKKLNNVSAVKLVKKTEDLDNIDGLILPGGESTAIGKLLENYGLVEPIRHLAEKGMPIWGTCAGMILMAKKIVNQEKTYLELMDIEVRRNGYGGQLDSFVAEAVIPDVSDMEIPMIFIRAPYIESTEKNTRVLAALEGKIIAAEEGNLLATSFHPELTDNMSFHRYFTSKIDKWKSCNNKV